MKFLNIGLPNLSYKSPGSVQEFSQRTLTNLGYFWDVQQMAYYFLAGKNAIRVYNFDDPADFKDEGEEEGVHMEDEHHTGNKKNLNEEDAMMHDAPVGDYHGAGSGANFADNATIINMLQNMQVQQDQRYADECRRRVTFEAAQIE